MADMEIVASPTLDEQLVAGSRPFMERLGERIVESMQEHHTYTDQSGDLTRSMSFDVDDAGVLDVGVGEVYGRFLEQGTSHEPAQPFLLPALLEHTGVLE